MVRGFQRPLAVFTIAEGSLTRIFPRGSPSLYSAISSAFPSRRIPRYRFFSSIAAALRTSQG